MCAIGESEPMPLGGGRLQHPEHPEFSASNSPQWVRLIQSEDGSLSILITSLFLLTILLSFAIIDISGAYLAKRELINSGEAAISRAAHQIDLNRYYSGDRVQAGSNSNGPIYLIPIDCQAAAATFDSEVSRISLHGSGVNISQFSCEGDLLRVTLQSQIPPILRLPLLHGSVMNGLLTISATLTASNPIAN